MRAAVLVIVLAGGCMITATLSRAGEIVADHLPPETPDATAAEMTQCETKNGLDENCLASVKGMTGFEFEAMLDGCVSIPDDFQRNPCGNGIEKLRPQFVIGKELPPFPKLSAAEFAAIEIGCDYVKDAREKMQCTSGTKKLRAHLYNNN